MVRVATPECFYLETLHLYCKSVSAIPCHEKFYQVLVSLW